MVDNVKIIDGGATTTFIRSTGLAAGTQVMMSIPSKVDGTAFSAPATIALSLPVALPTDQIVSTLITNASVTALISNASITTLITNASITASITNASLTASITNASLTATIINASLTTLISNASVTTLISNASVTTLISNSFLTTALNTAYFTTGIPTSSNTALTVAISPNGLNANGSATAAGSAPIVIANDQQAIATLDNTRWLANGNSTTLATAIFTSLSMSTNATAQVVAAISTAKIRVIALHAIIQTGTSFKWQSGATDITGPMNFTTNGGYVLGYNPLGHFETAVGSALVGNSSITSQIGGALTYVLI
jgi:hypothetical protein